MTQTKLIVESLGRKSLQLAPNLTKTCCFYEVQKTPTKSLSTHMILLIDRSASMTGYLEDLKEMITLTIDQLKSSFKHRVSVISFGNDGEMEWLVDNLKASEAKSQLEFIHQRLEESCGDEFTVLSTALETTFHDLIKYRKQNEFVQVIVMPDGYLYSETTSLEVEQSRCYGWMLDFTAQKIVTQIIGVGTCNLNFLTQLAGTTKIGDFYPYMDRQSYRSCLKHWMKCSQSLLDASHQILNNNYFLSLTSQKVNQPRHLITMGNVSQLIVTFDEVLQIDDQLVPTIARDISDELEHQFKLSYAYYLLKQRQVNEATFLLKETHLFSVLNQGYSDDEICRSLAVVNRYRFQSKFIRPFKQASLKNISVLTLLEMILDDPFSTLLWQYEQKALPKIEEDNVTFIANEKRYFEVTNVKVSTTKQNITLTVKVDGVSKQKQTNLKLDCFVFRTYHLIEGGNLKLKQLACQLSPKLRKRFRELKLIKATTSDSSGIDVIDLKDLKLVTQNSKELIDSEQIAKQLYELEQTKLRIQILKTMLNQQWQKRKGNSVKDIGQHHQVSPSFMFQPQIKPSPLLKRDVTLQLVTEWTIENFSKSIERQKCYERIQSGLLTANQSAFNYLKDQLNQEKQKQLALQNKIYLLRLKSQLLNDPVFHWDEVNVVQEKHHQRVISKQKIGEIIIKENKYFIHSAT